MTNPSPEKKPDSGRATEVRGSRGTQVGGIVGIGSTCLPEKTASSREEEGCVEEFVHVDATVNLRTRWRRESASEEV